MHLSIYPLFEEIKQQLTKNKTDYKQNLTTTKRKLQQHNIKQFYSFIFYNLMKNTIKIII